MHIGKLSDIMAMVGQSISTGQCVEAVKQGCKLPPTANWRRGVLVKTAALIPAGTAIATFDGDGLYGNHEDGTSHAAIAIAVNGEGILVADQYVNPARDGKPATRQPVHFRLLRFNTPPGVLPVNSGDTFSTIQLATEAG